MIDSKDNAIHIDFGVDFFVMAFFCGGIFFVWEKSCNFVDYLRVMARALTNLRL